MQWLSLFVKLFLARRAWQDPVSIQEAAITLAEKGKRYLVGALLFCLSALFIFSALLLSIINLGLQLERDGAVSYSGLMISSTVLAGLALVLALFGAFLWSRKKEAEPASKASPAEGQAKELLDEFLVSFLAKLGSPSGPEKHK